MSDLLPLILIIWVGCGIIGAFFRVKAQNLNEQFHTNKEPDGCSQILLLVMNIAIAPLGGVVYLINGYKEVKGYERQISEKQARAWREQEEARRMEQERIAREKSLANFMSSPEYKRQQEEERQSAEKAARAEAIEFLALRNPTTDPSQFTEHAIQSAIKALRNDEMNRIAQQDFAQQIEQERRQTEQEKQQSSSIEEKRRYHYQVLYPRIGQRVYLSIASGQSLNIIITNVTSDAVLYDNGLSHQPGRIRLEDITYIG